MDIKPTKQNSSRMDSLSKTIAGIVDPLACHKMERLDDCCTQVVLGELLRKNHREMLKK